MPQARIFGEKPIHVRLIGKHQGKGNKTGNSRQTSAVDPALENPLEPQPVFGITFPECQTPQWSLQALRRAQVHSVAELQTAANSSLETVGGRLENAERRTDGHIRAPHGQIVQIRT